MPQAPPRSPIHKRGTMSEPQHDEEHELAEPTPTDVPEPDQDAETEEAEHEAHEHEQDEPEPTEAKAPPTDAAKEQRRVAAALKREHEAHDRKLEKILGDAHEHVLPCPLCGDGMQGYVFPGDGQMLDDETKGLVLAFLGEAAPNQLRPAEGAEMCDRCDGFGQLAWPTRNPHLQTQTCPKCSGNGYVLKAAIPSNVTEFPQGVYTQPTPPAGEVAPCPLCGAPNSAGKPHFCNPIGASGVVNA